MSGTGRGTLEAPAKTEWLVRLRWNMRMASVRGRLDMYGTLGGSVRAAIARHFSEPRAKEIERRFLEFRRRRTFVKRWLVEGIPHAERVVGIDGLGYLEDALCGGAGAILASAHFGHGRLIKPILALHDRPALLVGGRVWPAWPRIAAEDLPVSLNLRPHLAALRKNRPLIILVDGRAATSLTHIRVQGIGVGFAPGAMRMARVCGAPVLPTFVVDEGTLRDPLAIRLVIHAPLVLEHSEDPAADLQENLRRFAAVYAQELGRNPHNLNWRFVDPESGDWSPPEDPWLLELDHERTPDIGGGAVRR